MLKQTLIGVLFFAAVISLPNVYAEHIIKDMEAFGQILNLPELVGEKFFLKVDDQTYEMIYGYGGSFEDFEKQTNPAIVSEMYIDQDNKSFNIEFEKVPETQIFWILLPTEIISADKEKYRLLIDNVEKGYELTKVFDEYSLAFFLPENSQSVQIIGTYVVPEFGSMAVIVLGISIIGIVLFLRKQSLLNLKVI